jgi:ankyrin repeat protein
LPNTISYFDGEMNDGTCSQSSPDLCKYLSLCHRDSYGEIPLHIACRGLTSCSFEIISWLLERYPESASSRNKFGHLPMHLLAASEGHDADDDTIERCFNLLLKAYPSALYTQDNEGDIPLQCLLTHSNILPGLMRCLINNMTRITDENFYLMENPYTRHLPLHTACLNGLYSIDVMNQLVSLYPEALLHFDVDGLLPFHIALESPENCTVVILETLLYRPAKDAPNTAWQQSATLPCTAEGIPALFFACENAKGLDESKSDDDRELYDCEVLDTIRFLVERSPELFAKQRILS